MNSTMHDMVEALRLKMATSGEVIAAKDVEPVACPDCHNLPEIVVAKATSRRKKETVWMASHRAGCRRAVIFGAAPDEEVRLWNEQAQEGKV